MLATPDQVLVTNGSAEANYVAALRVIEPGDQVAMLLPNYLQLWGHVQNLGAQVRPFRLHEDRGWAPDPAEIRSAIAPGTKLVVVTNPHNPTGHILADAMRRAIIERTAEVGAWLLADEVYMGAERDGKTTASFWGSYDRLICVAGLSKAYGLPGLRIGWLVGPAPIVADAWARHDYTTIGPSGASDHLATLALQPAVRERGALITPQPRIVGTAVLERVTHADRPVGRFRRQRIDADDSGVEQLEIASREVCGRER